MPDKCIKCDISIFSNNVFGKGNTSSDIVFIGEAPGYHENKHRKPFVGDAGKVLTEILDLCGFNRDDVFITNAVKCRPEHNRTPDNVEIQNCRLHLIKEVFEINPKIVVLLGTVALRGLCGIYEDINFKKVRNKWFTFKGMKCILVYHPAYILRNLDKTDEYVEVFKMITEEYRKIHQLHIVKY